jgi:hypothetical protein
MTGYISSTDLLGHETDLKLRTSAFEQDIFCITQKGVRVMCEKV